MEKAMKITARGVNFFFHGIYFLMGVCGPISVNMGVLDMKTFWNHCPRVGTLTKKNMQSVALPRLADGV